jgi:hypothetical protein
MSTIPNAYAFSISRATVIEDILPMITDITQDPILTTAECNELLDQANARIKELGARLTLQLNQRKPSQQIL